MGYRGAGRPYVSVKNNLGMGGDFGAGALAGIEATAAADSAFFKNKYYTENLSFPLDVAENSQEGHYIIFSILEQDKAKLVANKIIAGATAGNMASEYGHNDEGAGYGAISSRGARRANSEKFVARNIAEGSENWNQMTTRSKAGLNNSIQLAQKATTRLANTIALYMPASVSVSYKAEWAKQEIGVGAEASAAAIKNWEESEGGFGDKAVASGKKMFEGALQAVKQKSIKGLEGAAPGAESLIAINRGKIITPRMELMFEGVGRREFSYAFTMIPKSDTEAKHIEKIVVRFKHAMAANYSTDATGAGADGVREMNIPSFFDIMYMYQDHENTHLNKISTCVLTSMDVEYGAERFKTYAGGVPQTTKITLNFAELNIITKKHIELGY